MRRTLSVPVLAVPTLVVVGIALLALVAGCSGTTRWSSRAVDGIALPTLPTGPSATGAPGPTPRPAPGTTTGLASGPGPTGLGGPQPRRSRTTRPGTPSTNAQSGPTAGSAPPGTASATSGDVAALSTSDATAWTSYGDPSGLTFTYPGLWTLNGGGSGPIVISIDAGGTDAAGFRRTVNVLEQPLPGGLNATGYLQVRMQQIVATGGTVDTDLSANLGGLPGRQVSWHIARGGHTVRFVTAWTVKGRLAFLVTYAADDRNFAAPLPAVRHLLASIRLP